MPNPKSTITIEQINIQFYQLNMIESVSSKGYTYRLDFNEHDSSVDHARSCYNSARIDFEEGIITSEEHQEHHDMYMTSLKKYLLVDEDDRICGEYSSSTKKYQLFYWRFTSEGTVYYYDENMEVFTYTGCYVGHLTDNMQIIRNLVSDSDSDSDYEDEDEDEDENEDEIVN